MSVHEPTAALRLGDNPRMGGMTSSTERKNLSNIERIAKILKDDNSKPMY